MAVKFTAGEILDMAVKIEQNGLAFYKQAAEKAGDDMVKQLLLNLASMEKEHIATFEKVRDAMTEEEKQATTFDPDNEAAMYLEAMADVSVFDKSKEVTDTVSGAESMEEILRIAINQEKESIAFYAGLREMVPASKGRDKVETVIKEEMGHVADLTQQLKTLKSQ